MATNSKNDPGVTATNPFGDLAKMLEQFKVPGVDMTSFIDARRKDVEALVQANKTAYEALQALAQTQNAMLTQAMQGFQESAMAMTTGKGGLPDPVQQTEAARQAWQKMLTDMTNLAQQAQQSQAAAIAGLTERAKESIAEAQKTLRPK